MICIFIEFIYEPASVQLLLFSLMALRSTAPARPFTLHQRNRIRQMAGRNEYRAADRRKERNLERKRRKQEENREECGWKECFLTGCSWFLQQFSAMEKLPVYSRMCLTLKPCSSCKVGAGTGITAAASDFVASALDSLSGKHCAKAHCVFCDVIYVMVVVASGDFGLSVITLKYRCGLNLYVLSSFQPSSVVVILQHSPVLMKNTKASLSTFLQESIRLLKEPLC